MTCIETSSIGLHKHHVSNNFHAFGNVETLLQSISHEARKNHTVNHVSASRTLTSHQHIAPDITSESHRSVDAISNFSDGMSLTDGSDVESELEYDTLVYSHLQGRLHFTN